MMRFDSWTSAHGESVLSTRKGTSVDEWAVMGLWSAGVLFAIVWPVRAFAVYAEESGYLLIGYPLAAIFLVAFVTLTLRDLILRHRGLWGIPRAAIIMVGVWCVLVGHVLVRSDTIGSNSDTIRIRMSDGSIVQKGEYVERGLFAARSYVVPIHSTYYGHVERLVGPLHCRAIISVQFDSPSRVEQMLSPVAPRTWIAAKQRLNEVVSMYVSHAVEFVHSTEGERSAIVIKLADNSRWGTVIGNDYRCY